MLRRTLRKLLKLQAPMLQCLQREPAAQPTAIELLSALESIFVVTSGGTSTAAFNTQSAGV